MKIMYSGPDNRVWENLSFGWEFDFTKITKDTCYFNLQYITKSGNRQKQVPETFCEKRSS